MLVGVLRSQRRRLNKAVGRRRREEAGDQGIGGRGGQYLQAGLSCFGLLKMEAPTVPCFTPASEDGQAGTGTGHPGRGHRLGKKFAGNARG